MTWRKHVFLLGQIDLEECGYGQGFVHAEARSALGGLHHGTTAVVAVGRVVGVPEVVVHGPHDSVEDAVRCPDMLVARRCILLSFYIKPQLHFLCGHLRLDVKCYTVQMYKIVGQTYIGKGHFEYHTSCELNGFFLSSPQLAILLLSVSFSLSLSFINNL